MTRSRSRILLALLLGLGMVAASATAGYLAHPVPAKDGVRLIGRVLAEQFRPAIAGACDLPVAKAQARSLYADEQVKSALLRLLTPAPAYADRVAPCQQLTHRFGRNLIVNAGEAFLVDAWQNLVELEVMKYHGLGTTNTAAAETDTALAAESTTVLNPDSTRATGSLTEASASVFRTVGTLTFDGAAAIVEWGLFTQAATGGGTMFSRIVFTVINVASAD